MQIQRKGAWTGRKKAETHEKVFYPMHDVHKTPRRTQNPPAEALAGAATLRDGGKG
jgi:hypothetical protein